MPFQKTRPVVIAFLEKNVIKFTATVSSLRKPAILPEPYWISIFLPLAWYVLDLLLSYWLCFTAKEKLFNVFLVSVGFIRIVVEMCSFSIQSQMMGHFQSNASSSSESVFFFLFVFFLTVNGETKLFLLISKAGLVLTINNHFWPHTWSTFKGPLPCL